MLGLPGDFTPPYRFIRAAYFVSNTNKELLRVDAILQGFRILSQFDIPKGAVVDIAAGHTDETLYTVMYDTNHLSYHIKNHNNINIQNFNISDYSNIYNTTFITLNKTMSL